MSAIKNYTNRELGLILENLSCKLDDGFKGVYLRQDHTNGNVKKNSEFRVQSEAVIGTFKWLIATIGVSNFATIIYLFLNR